MLRTVTVGLDDSPESRAEAEWAARDSPLGGRPLLGRSDGVLGLSAQSAADEAEVGGSGDGGGA